MGVRREGMRMLSRAIAPSGAGCHDPLQQWPPQAGLRFPPSLSFAVKISFNVNNWS